MLSGIEAVPVATCEATARLASNLEEDRTSSEDPISAPGNNAGSFANPLVPPNTIDVADHPSWMRTDIDRFG